MTRSKTLLLVGAFALLALAASSCSYESVLAGMNNIDTRGLKVVTDQAYGNGPRQKLDVYAPAGAQNAPVVLFIHGGSWSSGDKNNFRFVGESLSRAGYVVGVMNYRLAPQNRYPSYIQDAALALKWLQDHAKAYGGRPDNLFISGHSAGGFNAVELAVNQRWLAEVGVPIQAVRGVIGLAGPYSYDFRQFSSRNAFPENSTPDEIMPDRHVRPDAPPHLLLIAANDKTVYPQNALNMQAALKKAGVSVQHTILPNLDHVTIVGALSLKLRFLGGTRAKMIEFIEARRLR